MKVNNKIIMIVFVLFALVSCNSHQTSNDKTDNFANFPKEKVGKGHGDLTKIKDSDAIHQKYLYTNYMKVYSKYIVESIDTSAYRNFYICYIDNDTVPELCLAGTCWADGNIILTQQDGIVYSYETYVCPEYILKGGLILNSCSHYGSHETIIVKLTNGSFKEILHTEVLEPSPRRGGRRRDLWTYYINNKLIASLSGDTVNELSCTRINNAIEQAYYSKGRSYSTCDVWLKQYYISSLYDKPDNVANFPEKKVRKRHGNLTKFKNSNTISKKYLCTKWMKVYSKYIVANIDTSAYQEFIICYIDNDTVPELCLEGTCWADGNLILTQQNGIVYSYKTAFCPEYILKGGLILDGWSHGGSHGTNIVKLTNGSFKEILHTEVAEPSPTRDFWTYYINGKLIASLSGDTIDELSCTRINNAIEQAYYSKGRSYFTCDMRLNGYTISSLYARTDVIK